MKFPPGSFTFSPARSMIEVPGDPCRDRIFLKFKKKSMFFFSDSGMIVMLSAEEAPEPSGLGTFGLQGVEAGSGAL